MLVEKLKSRLKDAMKNKQEVEKSILRVALGDIETQASRQHGKISEEQVHAVLRKLVDNNLEAISTMPDRRASLTEENAVLETFLPKLWSKEKIYSFLATAGLLDIVEAKSAGQAVGNAIKSLKKIEADVAGKDVKEVVEQIRNEHATVH